MHLEVEDEAVAGIDGIAAAGVGGQGAEGVETALQGHERVVHFRGSGIADTCLPVWGSGLRQSRSPRPNPWSLIRPRAAGRRRNSTRHESQGDQKCKNRNNAPL